MAKKMKVTGKKDKAAKVEKKERVITKPVTRSAFTKTLAKELEVSVAGAVRIYDAFFGVVKKYLKDGRKIVVTKFGKFFSQHRKERPGFNPKAQKKITVPACTVVKFRPSKDLKDMVNGR